MHWIAVGKPTKKPKGMSSRLGKKQTQNPTINRDQSACGSARELLLAGPIRRESHQTITVPAASVTATPLAYDHENAPAREPGQDPDRCLRFYESSRTKVTSMFTL